MLQPRRWFGLLVVCALLLGAPADAAPKKNELRRRLNAAARLYEDLEYEKALAQLKRAKALNNLSADEEATVAIYQGLVLADLGRQQEATDAFTEGLSLKPDATLPIKVSPKVERLFEEVRAETQRMLAKIEARDDGRLRKEEERQEAERKAAEEQARLAAERQAAEEARLVSERKAAEEAQAKLAAERKAAEEAQAKLAAERKATEEARLHAQRQDAEEARQPQVARGDVPTATQPGTRVQVTPVPREPAQEALASRPRLERSTPTTPYVLAGVAVLAGGVGGYFGMTSKSQADEARKALYQDDTLRYLEDSKNNALAANVLMGAASAALVASVITFFTLEGDELPATTTAQEGE